MKVNSLKLVNFRNFKEESFKFKNGINLIAAPNGSGKTNILESIRIMCYGKPIFASKETDVINLENAASSLPFTKVIMEWENYEGSHDSVYTLSPTIKPTKSLVLDNRKRMQKHFAGKFSVVWFSPETLNLITATPRMRRLLLDVYFCQLDENYAYALSEYESALEARNRVLKSQDRGNIPYYLKKYNKILVDRAIDLMVIKFSLAHDLYKVVFIASQRQQRYDISWEYEPNIEKNEIFDINLHAKMHDMLLASEAKDIATKRTNIGPHRDNWTLNLVDRYAATGKTFDLRLYGSRGQKRMGLLIFTLAIVDILERVKKSKPVLLLDDVVSELDEENVSLILQMLHRKDQQSIITSTHDKILGLENVNLIRLNV